MSQPPLTAFDLAVFLVVGLSAFLSLVRGAVREVLSIATWIGAIVVTYYGFPYAQDIARRTIDAPWMADLAALAVLFIVPLIGFKLVAATVSDHLPGGAFGAFDRIAGAAFGAVRGVAIVCAAYLGLSLAIEPADHPPWVKDAAVLPYVKEGADLLARLVPEEAGAEGGEALRALGGRGQALGRLNKAVRELTPQ